MDNNFKFKVNLGGMIDILSNHLYSSPDVFVRELLQNCTDAVTARIEKDKNFSEKDALIEIEVISGKKIIFRDNGTGLDEDEIHRFLSVIGQSSKYRIETDRSEGDYIGRFGIGLLSCFMVTDSICVRTSSYKTPGKTLEWNGLADGTYTIREIDVKMPCGTEVIVENNKQDKGAELTEDYYNPDSIATLIYYYGLYLQYPIYTVSDSVRTRLNLNIDFFKSNSKEMSMKLGTTFLGEKFLDCFPLTSEKGLFNGIAYVMKNPVSANVHNMHRIYLKNMLLTENGDKLLPEWAFFIRCIINTRNLTPTSSREDFYEDELLDEAREEIGICIADYFEYLEENNPSILGEIVRIHHLAVKSVIASDNSADDILLPYITFETTAGVMTAKELTDFVDNVFYTTDVNQYKQLSPIYTQCGEVLLNAGYVYDSAIIEKLKEKSFDTNFEKLNEMDIDFILDDSRYEDDAKAEIFIAEASKVLKKFKCQVFLREFEPNNIPTLYTISEKAENFRQIERSKENANSIFADMLNSFETTFEKSTSASFYLNTANKVIQKMIDGFDQTNTEKMKCCIEILYVQALLAGHFPLLHNEMNILTQNLLYLISGD